MISTDYSLLLLHQQPFGTCNESTDFFTDIAASMKEDVRPSRTVKIEIIITSHLLSYHEMLLNHAHWAFQFHSAH